MSKVKEKIKLDIEKLDCLDFASIGLACHALCLIEYAEILTILKVEGSFPQPFLKSYRNPHLIRAALTTLVGTKLLKLDKKLYRLTALGKKISKNISILMLPFVGYRHLLARQFELLNKPNSWKQTDIDYPSIALSSIGFGQYELDPILFDVFRTLKPKGMICDLGCGTGEKLVTLCKALGVRGLGIEKNWDVIQKSEKYTKNSKKIEIIQGDITNLKGVWKDVETAMINFVFHDIDSTRKSTNFLRSLHKHFPRLRYLIVTDIVSLSESFPSIMPGFDYVHGLQGITPRSHEETLRVFEKANFKIMEEISIPNMPNTFVWILSSKNHQFK